MKSFTLIIQKIRKETNESVTLCFKQPGLRKIKYQAGQFITIIIRIDGRRYARPYSFSSAPSVDEFLEITVKRVEGGIVSNYINEYLKEGDLIEILEPMGTFVYDSSFSNYPIYLWGVGSGITPLFSIIKEILHKKQDSPVYLVYGNQNEDSTIFKDQLKNLQKNNDSVFFVTNFYSRENKANSQISDYKSGRITENFVQKYLETNNNINESKHYICGPKDFKDSILNSLKILKVPISSIFVEDFELDVDTNDMIGVENSSISILFNGVERRLFVPIGKSILDAALDNDLELPYSCQTGSCSTCKAVLKDGRLKMLGMSTQRVDLKANEFLLCCSYPFSSQISLEITQEI